MNEFDLSPDVPEGSAVPEGEPAPAPLSDAPQAVENEEEPPDETEPLLPSVNPKIGPETRSARAARYRALSRAGRAAVDVMAGENPESALAVFRRSELERDRRMEAVRAAFIKSKKK